MIIAFSPIPHRNQRYETLGDWFYKGEGFLQIHVSLVGNEDYEFLLLFHELVEAWLCRKRNISSADVDRFDMSYVGDGEPGDHPTAPYHKEHVFATLLEKTMAGELGIDWDEYEHDLELFLKSRRDR